MPVTFIDHNPANAKDLPRPDFMWLGMGLREGTDTRPNRQAYYHLGPDSLRNPALSTTCCPLSKTQDHVHWVFGLWRGIKSLLDLLIRNLLSSFFRVFRSYFLGQTVCSATYGICPETATSGVTGTDAT